MIKTHPGNGRAGVAAVMQERGSLFDQGRQRLGLLDAIQRIVAYLTRLLPVLDFSSLELHPGSSKTCNCIAFSLRVIKSTSYRERDVDRKSVV